jgi:amino acid transporter
MQPLLGDHPSGSSLSGILAVLATAPFFFAGFGVIAQAMADVRSPETIKRMPWIMAAVILGTMAFYVLIIWAASLGAPRAQVLDSSLPAATAFAVAFKSEWGARLVLILGLLGLFSILNGICFAAIRTIQILAKLGFIPMIFDREHEGTKIAPASALFVAASALGLAALGREIIPVLINVASVSLSAIMAFVCFVLFHQRRTTGAPTRALIVPGIGTAVAATMAVLPLYSALESAQGFPPQEWLAIIVWVMIGAVFLLVIRYLPNHYHAPDVHVFAPLTEK